MKCFISRSGMPECKLGLNDRVLLEAQGRSTKGKAIDMDDIKFHQYVACFVICIFLLVFGFSFVSFQIVILDCLYLC